jgi:cobalt-zinc-cadmium efflux system protein
VGVIVAAIVIWQTGWMLADPVASVFIGVIIIAGSSRVIRDSFHIIMEVSTIQEAIHTTWVVTSGAA